MLKAQITQEELDSGRIEKQVPGVVRLEEMYGQEVPQVLVELTSAMKTLKEHRVVVKQLENEIEHSEQARTLEQLNKLESLYMLERSYIQ